MRLIRVKFLLVLRPNLTLFDCILFHELNQVCEVESHVVHCPILIGPQLGQLGLDESGMGLAYPPHSALVLRCDHLDAVRVLEELLLVSLGHAGNFRILPARRVLLREQSLLLLRESLLELLMLFV